MDKLPLTSRRLARLSPDSCIRGNLTLLAEENIIQTWSPQIITFGVNLLLEHGKLALLMNRLKFKEVVSEEHDNFFFFLLLLLLLLFDVD